jgi:cysteine desulfurase/selenocysteine lyase
MADLNARAAFPVFVQNPDLHFLDTAASAQKPQVVLDALQNALSDHYANIHRGLYDFSARSTADFEKARYKVAVFIKAKENEIVFTRSATESINLVASSWGSANLKNGDEILITELEHHANIVPWQMIAEKTGAKLVVAPITDKGDIRAEDVIKLIGTKTKMVAVSHMSNALGTILPVAEIIAAAKKSGAATLIDGAQAVLHIPVDVKALGCDFYVFSGHKLYGPTGIGVLYGREEILNAMPPYQGGGDMIETVGFDKTTYKNAPARFEAGTPAIAEAIALGAAVDFVTGYGISQIAQYEQELYDYALHELQKIDGLHLYGQGFKRASILTFTIDGLNAADVAMILDKEKVCVRVGHHCAMPLLKRLCVPATIRASIGMYNNRADIDALVVGLNKAKKMLS